MIFAISDRPLMQYQHQCPVTDRWILHSVERTNKGLLGYRMHQFGGNFIQVDGSQHWGTVEWSFYQDFPLWRDLDRGILVSNDPREVGSPLPLDTIAVSINNDSQHWHRIDWRPFVAPDRSMSVSVVMQQLRERIHANLAHCLNIAAAPKKIVFTGGLDSSLLAFMAQQQNIDFHCVINLDHRDEWERLPFSNIIYRESGMIQDDWGMIEAVRESYYGPGMTDCITGFFGDTAMLHNNTLFYQCSDLYQDAIDLYDRSPPDNVPKFRDKIQPNLAAVNIMRTTRFRHWFDGFRILDPYRDPDLTRLVLHLPWEELCRQFACGWIQKQFITDMNLEWASLLLSHKNEYPRSTS